MLSFYSVTQLCPTLCNPMDCRLPCPPSAGVCSNSDPLSWRCHPIISSSVAPFSSCPQSLPASWPVPVSWLFTSGGQSIGVSATLLPMNIQDRFPLGLTGWISLQSKRCSSIFSNTKGQKHQFFAVHHSLWSSSHIHTWLLEKNHHFAYMDLVSTVMSLLSNTLSKFVLAFLPRSKCLWLHGYGHDL